MYCICFGTRNKLFRIWESCKGRCCAMVRLPFFEDLREPQAGRWEGLFEYYNHLTMSSSSSSSTRQPDTGPLLGSAYLTSQSLIPPASPSELNASLCLNISLFKNTLKRYRALDDAITTRLNRDQALHREYGGNTEEGQKSNCLRIWRDILGMVLA